MDSSNQKVIWPPSTQLTPVPAVLVGCGSAEADWNLITVAWTGIVCSKPPMLSVSVRPERHSHGLIRQSGEFTVNIPTAAMAADVDWCGVVSGRDHRKFAERHLTPLAGSKVAAPLVAECPLGLECRVTQVL
ncbi:MAG: flavin reductase family protein, partial [Lentisphaeria bacterium]|nr:flavin reductase family protein [Lentisphaeria bacterium]